MKIFKIKLIAILIISFFTYGCYENTKEKRSKIEKSQKVSTNNTEIYNKEILIKKNKILTLKSKFAKKIKQKHIMDVSRTYWLQNIMRNIKRSKLINDPGNNICPNQLPQLTKTLVVFLTKYPETDDSDLSGVKQALENEIYSQITKLSYNRAMLDVTYAGPYKGDIENCTAETNLKCTAIIEHAVNEAYHDGIDVTQFSNIIALRNDDFFDDDCFCTGTGSFSNNINYDGGKLTAGMTTIAYPRTFTSPTFGQGTRRTLHEFLHSFCSGTSHAYELVCYSDPDDTENTKVPYYYDSNESVLTSPYCKRKISSLIDVMGMCPDDYIAINGITKLQYGWFLNSNVITFDISSLEKESVSLETLDPLDSIGTTGPKMIKILIPDTTKAYVLEHRSIAVTGMGVYLYLMPNVNNLTYEEQYLLNTGNTTVDGYVAPLTPGETLIDPKHNLYVNIKSVNEHGAELDLIIK